MSRAKPSSEPILVFPDAAAFDSWLRAHHGSSQAFLLTLAKKGGRPGLTYADALDVALAWGFIDSHKQAKDQHTWLQRFSPRTAKSPWSKINREKAEALIVAGKMHAAGLAEVERAKRDGRWARAYDGARSSAVPADLLAALARNRRAQAFFETLDAANRYAILYRVQTAVKPATRAERIARFVALCARHETIHPSRPAKTSRSAKQNATRAKK